MLCFRIPSPSPLFDFFVFNDLVLIYYTELGQLRTLRPDGSGPYFIVGQPSLADILLFNHLVSQISVSNLHK